MNYKKARVISWILFSIVIALVILLLILARPLGLEGNSIVAPLLFVFELLIGSIAIYISIKYNRCPDCKKSLWKNRGEYCQHCGVCLEDALWGKFTENKK